jgi:hypothetical protein
MDAGRIAIDASTLAPYSQQRGCTAHDPHVFLTSLARLRFRLHTITPRRGFRSTTIDRLLASECEELYLRR